ncbi:MAG: SRPBCC family protein, partial [Candidatus Limnocylindrales bacterium]
MGTHRLSVQVAAPPERVFGLWTDLDRMKDWVGGVTRVSDLTGPVAQAGTSYTVWFGPMANRTEVLEADPPHFLRTRFGTRLLAGESSARFVAD